MPFHFFVHRRGFGGGKTQILALESIFILLRLDPTTGTTHAAELFRLPAWVLLVSASSHNFERPNDILDLEIVSILLRFSHTAWTTYAVEFFRLHGASRVGGGAWKEQSKL